MGWTHFHLRFSRGGQIGVFGSAPDPPGPKKGPKGPFWGHPRKKRVRQARSQRNFGEFRFDPLGFLRFVHKRPGDAVSPSGLWPFSAVSRNAFRPGEPRNGPESRFFFSDPTIIWEKGNLGAPGSACPLLLLGEMPKVYVPFRPPGARKTAETARFGWAAGKIELTAASAPKFRSSDPLESSGLMEKRPRYGPFLPKISFHLPTKPC